MRLQNSFNYSEEQILTIQETVNTLTHEAFDLCEKLSLLLMTDSQKVECSIRDSARAAMDACLSIFQITPTSDQNRVEQWVQMNANTQFLSFENSIRFLTIFREAEGLQGDKSQKESYHRYIRVYIELLEKLLKNVKFISRHELLTPAQRKQYQRRKNLYKGGVFSIVLGFGLLFLVYRLQAPEYIFHDQAQIFWKSGSNGWSEQHSHKFMIKVNNHFEDQRITLPDAVHMKQLRFDPLNRKLPKVLIEQIQVLDTAGQVWQQYDFKRGDTQWLCVKCKKVDSPEGMFAFHPKSDDPFLVSPEFPEKMIQYINLKVHLSEPTPFWQWLLRVKRY